MSKHVLQEPKGKKPTEADVLADLLAHGSPTYEHAQESGTGRPVEAIYAGDGHDRMMADTIAAANHNDDKDETPIK
jgi:hypothetical protein